MTTQPSDTADKAKPPAIRIDDPVLSFARLELVLRELPLDLKLRVRDALTKHHSNIASRLSNEAQVQTLAGEAWDAESGHAGRARDCFARSTALAWAQAAITSACGLALRPIPFEVPRHWNAMPEPEVDLSTIEHKENR